MPKSTAEIVQEYGPFPGVGQVHGVTYDGRNVWFASGDKLTALDPASGQAVRSLDVAARAGTAFDGKHLFQIADGRIRKIDPQTGQVLATIPAPGGGQDSGLAWAEGTLWVGQYRDTRSIPAPARSSAPSSPTASSPASPGSMENSGTPPRRPETATCGASTRKPASSWKLSKCLPISTFRASSRMVPAGFSAAEGKPERSAPSGGRSAPEPPHGRFPKPPLQTVHKLPPPCLHPLTA